MAEKVLEVKSLTKRIRQTAIVDDVSFDVKKGEIFGLLGPNGAGKTTIIRMIGSLINRTNGKVVINGHDLDGEFEKAMSDLGAIVENPEFYKYMSGRKNLIHYARMATTPIEPGRLDEVAKLVKLDHAMEKKVKTYSLGMRQRLGVAQAILHKPALLILDEPTAGLDPKGRDRLLNLLTSLHEDTDMTVILVSHSMEDVAKVAKNIVVMNNGSVYMHAPVANVFEKGAELEKIGLSIPQVTTLINRLRQMGAELPKDIYTVKYAANILSEAMKGKSDD